MKKDGVTSLPNYESGKRSGEIIETKYVKAWREMYESMWLLAPEDGEYKDRPIVELLETPQFKASLAEGLFEGIREAKLPRARMMTAMSQEVIVGFRAAQDFKLLSTDMLKAIEEQICSKDFKENLFTEIFVPIDWQMASDHKHYSHPDSIAITYTTACKLNLLNMVYVSGIVRGLSHENFKSDFMESVIASTKEGQHTGWQAYNAVVAFEAGKEMELLTPADQVLLEKEMHTDAFTKVLEREVVRCVEWGQDSGHYALLAVTILQSLKRMSPNHEEVN